MKEDERRRQRILQTYQEIGGIKATARKLKVSIHVVRRVLRAGLEPTAHAGVVRVPAVRKSQLDAYKPMIGRMVLDDKLTAVLVLEELRRLGYAGGYSILKAYVRTIRASGTFAAAASRAASSRTKTTATSRGSCQRCDE